MFIKRNSMENVTEMCCCGCFGFFFVRSPKKTGGFHSDAMSGTRNENDFDLRSPKRKSKEILMNRMQRGLICREFFVKETHSVLRSEDENGNKTINEYVRERKIAAGSYGKVVLYRCRSDGAYYAIKAFHKSHLSKLRVTSSETAMTDVLQEILIMKVLSHPNIVNLVKVIDDPTEDHLYMVLEYVEGKCVCEGADLPGGLGEETARKYLRDVVSGLMYLHSHNIVHGAIKPENLLVTGSGMVKIGDFSVSQVFEDDYDELTRSPGTPAFTALSAVWADRIMEELLIPGQLALPCTIWFWGNTRFYGNRFTTSMIRS